MIFVTRLDNRSFLLNLANVKHIESTPDTLITFVNGDTIIIIESLEDIERDVIKFKSAILEKAMKVRVDASV